MTESEEMTENEKWIRLGKLLRIPKRRMLKTLETYGTLEMLLGLPCCTTLKDKELWKLQEFLKLSRAFMPRLESPVTTILDLWALVDSLGPVEQMWVMACVGDQVLKPWPVGYGAVDRMTVHIPTVIAYLLRVGANAFYVAHSHQAGFPYPSTEDLELTSDLARMAATFEITLMDHIIITPYTLYSIARSGTLEELPPPPDSDGGCLFVVEGVPDEVTGVSEGSGGGNPVQVGGVPERDCSPADGLAAQDISQ